MPRFSANASMIFLEYDLLDRFAVAAREGFEAIELQFPYDTPAADLKDAKEDSGLEIAGINIPVGDLSTGGRGNASIPGKEDEFKASVEVAYEYAEVCRPRTMNVLPGFPPLDEFEREQCLDVLAGNLCVAAEGLQELGVKVMTEAVNTVDPASDWSHPICRHAGPARTGYRGDQLPLYLRGRGRNGLGRIPGRGVYPDRADRRLPRLDAGALIG